VAHLPLCKRGGSCVRVAIGGSAAFRRETQTLPLQPSRLPCKTVSLGLGSAPLRGGLWPAQGPRVKPTQTPGTRSHLKGQPSGGARHHTEATPRRKSAPRTTSTNRKREPHGSAAPDSPARPWEQSWQPTNRTPDARVGIGSRCKRSASIRLPRGCHRIPPKCTARAGNWLGICVQVEYGGTRVPNRGGS
jgi:hypothetical protein